MNNMRKILLFILFSAVGIWVFMVGGYLKTFSVETRTIIKITNVVVLLALTLICSRPGRWKSYFPIMFSFLMAALGLLFAWIVGDAPLNVLGWSVSTSKGIAMAKVFEALPMVIPALVLVYIFENGYQNIHLSGGQIGLSLLLGLGMSALVLVVFVVISDVIPKIPSMISSVGWVLLFSFMNSFMEELLFRALFLKKLEKFFPPLAALLLTTIVFTAPHLGASYISGDNMLVSLTFIFFIGFISGGIMQRSGSIWGAVLGHGFGDILLLVSVLGVVGPA
jgi:membrane protease YdiL (CAAX protease family)